MKVDPGEAFADEMRAIRMGHFRRAMGLLRARGAIQSASLFDAEEDGDRPGHADPSVSREGALRGLESEIRYSLKMSGPVEVSPGCVVSAPEGPPRSFEDFYGID